MKRIAIAVILLLCAVATTSNARRIEFDGTALKGAYSAETAYVQGDIVGGRYLCYPTAGMGTAWRHMREYVKAPTAGQSDGEVKLWIDDNLIFSVTNANLYNLNNGGSTITHITVAPVDESATAHEHWYDNITVYEGYVPPGEAPASSGSLRPGVSASGVTFR